MFTTGAGVPAVLQPDDVPDRGPDRRQDVQLDRDACGAGSCQFSTPLLFAIGFLTMFLIGGLNGAFSAAVPVDFALHDTYWVVAHLHYVLFGGSVFGVFAGIYYWFPKMTGRMLDESAGQAPVHPDVHRVQPDVLPDAPAGPRGHAPPDRRLLGDGRLDRAQRRWPRSAASSSRSRMIPFLWNVFVSLRNGKVAGDDPWEANTLEWATSSPPPPVQLRPPAGGPLGAPGVRRPPRPDGRPLTERRP